MGEFGRKKLQVANVTLPTRDFKCNKRNTQQCDGRTFRRMALNKIQERFFWDNARSYIEDLRLPCDLLFGRTSDGFVSTEQYLQTLPAWLEEIHHFAQKRIHLVSERMTTRDDIKTNECVFKDGDKKSVTLHSKIKTRIMLEISTKLGRNDTSLVTNFAKSFALATWRYCQETFEKSLGSIFLEVTMKLCKRSVEFRSRSVEIRICLCVDYDGNETLPELKLI
ncbi:hypothetical protein TNCV_3340631 [Trichonephila clavipes]|nr:hypothetical protein TNCV_3340631 [Trichonephila clavipes]